MTTFNGKYSGRNFIYSDENEALRMQLVSILNTPMGSRFYYPSYGSHLNEYRFSVLNYFTINMIGQEIKNAISLLSGITLSSMSYYITDNVIHFNIELNKMSNKVSINLSVVDGVAS